MSSHQNQLSSESTTEVWKAEEPEDKILPLVRLYYKIGGYFKISWAEFTQTPWWVIKQIALLMDEKESDMNQFIGMEEAAIFKNLQRMFPKKD